jgi:LTXXQ motif family protein
MSNPCTAIAIGCVVTSLIVVTPAQAQPAQLTQLFPALVGIELQPTQQAKLEQLSQQTLPEIRQLLSPEQVPQFDAVLKQGQSVRVALFSLNLSTAQKFKLTRKLNSIRSQLGQILTPEQQQQVAQNARSLPPKP